MPGSGCDDEGLVRRQLLQLVENAFVSRNDEMSLRQLRRGPDDLGRRANHISNC